MKKVGIITLFHGSMNYGGVLQACALCKALEQLEIPSEQIRCVYIEQEPPRDWGRTLKKLMNPGIVWNRIRYEIRGRQKERAKSGRQAAFSEFNTRFVPSSQQVYTSENVAKCLPDYGAFVTGSDQVWNPDWYCPTLFLDFVPEGKKKIAYGASLGKSSLSREQQAIVENHLRSFQAISVRESDAVNILTPLAQAPVECVLDPTLLLTREQWEGVCEPRMVEQPYLFYYFLGADREQYQLVREYAEKHGLKIVGIPNAARDFEKEENMDYDATFPDAGPGDFLSLIRYADTVFTDSFHATVFSNVFSRAFFVFPREGSPGMSSRIHQVTALFHTQERFCDSPERRTMAYLEETEPIAPGEELLELEQMRRTSQNFLIRNLRPCNEKTEGEAL